MKIGFYQCAGYGGAGEYERELLLWYDVGTFMKPGKLDDSIGC